MSENVSFGIHHVDDDVISRDNYVMISKQPPSWIRHLGFKFFRNVRKPLKITEKVTMKWYIKELKR